MESPELEVSAASLTNVLSKASIVVLIVASLAGCASQPTAPQVFPEWWNRNLEGHALQQQFRVDDPYCTNAANGSVPMPQVRVYRPEQESYQISAKVRTTDSNFNVSTQEIEATVRPAPKGIAQSMNEGMEMARREEAQRQAVRIAEASRTLYYEQCMYALGWEQRYR